MIIGCIADDFTGAGDAASYLSRGGMETLMFNGVPEDESDYSEVCDAIVVALKTRTAEKETAVRETLQAVRWLSRQGTKQYYLKYCSTFDSTPEGNIGPTADAVLDALDAERAVICPALPENGRIVVGGSLYVNGVPLDESPMKDHPLTPMWDHRIKNLMECQSRYRCIETGMERAEAGEFVSLAGERVYYIPDYKDEQDGEKIAEIFGDDLFLTGGSGLLEKLAEHWIGGEKRKREAYPPVGGRTLLLAGSCSEMTRKQIAFFQASGGKSLKVDPEALLEGAADSIVDLEDPGGSEMLLLYSSDTPENVKKVQEKGKELAASAIEQFFASTAVLAYQKGCRKIVVAGGETSGAVIRALGFSRYIVGESIAPGVPVLIPMEDRKVRLVLKSGNFGAEDFFIRAIKRISEEETP